LLQTAEVADWEPAVGQTLTPATQTIEILVHERTCASGDSAEGRIQEPAVQYQQDAVIVTIKVKPKTEGQDCPDNPLTPFTLELEEPLGDRPLLMGGRGEPKAPDADR
jgi:hypothetical protein